MQIKYMFKRTFRHRKKPMRNEAARVRPFLRLGLRLMPFPPLLLADQ
jgi:hypothetical protein